MFHLLLSSFILFYPIRCLDYFCLEKTQLFLFHLHVKFRMKKQKSIFDEFRYFFIYSAICGLWPSWRNSKFPILPVLYSVFHIFVITVLCLLSMWTLDLSGNDFSAIARYGQPIFCSILFTHLVVIVEAVINRSAQVRLIEKISAVDRLFKNKLCEAVSYEKEKRAIFIRLSILIIITFPIQIVLTIHLNHQNKVDTFRYLCFVSTWIIRMRVIQVMIFAILLGNRLRLVCEKLNETRMGYNLYRRRTNQWIFTHDSNTGFVLDSLWTNNSLYDRLIILKRIYSELYEICEQISSIFGLSALTIIAQCFIEVTVNSYCIYLNVHSEKPNIIKSIDRSLLIAPVSILLGISTYYCSSCSCYVSKKLQQL